MRTILAASFVVLSAIPAGAALAQGGLMSQARPRGGDGDAAKSFLVSVPVITATNELLAHMEFNLGGQAAIGIEGGIQRTIDRGDKRDIAAPESLTTSAQSLSLFVARFTEGPSLGGFYWLLGAGYRQETATWSYRPADGDKGVNWGLVDAGTGYLNHDATLSGKTAGARLGYRWVASEWPLAVGLYLGAKHFEATVRDVEHEDGDTVTAADGTTVTYTDMSDAEKKSLKNRMTTSLDAGLEIGFAF